MPSHASSPSTILSKPVIFDSHNSLVIPREEGPYAGIHFDKLKTAFNNFSGRGRSINDGYLRKPQKDNFRLIPIPLVGDVFIFPELEELKAAFRIKEIESLVRVWSNDNSLSLEKASLQINILTDGNLSQRHEHRQTDRRKWALITMIHRSAKGSIFWTEQPSLSPKKQGPIILRDLKPGDSIFFDASTYHGSTLTKGKGMVARAAWGFS